MTKVKTDDEKWAIINKDDVTLFFGADAIGKIGTGNCIVSAMIGGHPALLTVYQQGMGKVDVSVVLDQYETITNVADNRFAIVADAKGRKGVVSISGEMIIEAKYVSVDYELISSGTQDKDIYCFTLEKANGTYDYQMYETK